MINTKRASFGPNPPQNASLLLEKTKANIRRSTPDSEALASSDDDQEQLHRSITMSAQQPPKPTRRPSWLSDTYATTQRKASSGSLDVLASGAAHQMNSSMDSSHWTPPGSSGGRGHTGSASLPWNNAIWSNDYSKILPARFAEVLPSPTSIPTSSGAAESAVKTSSPPPRRDMNPDGTIRPPRRDSDAAIPFPIPLQPTLKTYRSQSYSVGQMEQEANATPGGSRAGQMPYGGRTRAGTSFGSLHHRQGRPSLYDFPGDNLGQVQEVEDDEESATSSDGGVRFANSQARTIEHLAMENALLRQQALANHTSSNFTGTFGIGTNPIPRSNLRGFQLTDSVLEEPDDHTFAEDDHRSSNHSSLSGLAPHRYNGSVEGLRNASPEAFGNGGSSKSPAGFKRGHWQSSAPYGNFGESAQNRRHSFADVPRRAISGTPHDSNHAPLDSARARVGFAEPSTPQNDGSTFLPSTPPWMDAHRASSSHGLSGGLPSGLNTAARQHASQFGQPTSHLPKHLYLVTFKAARAEFYYVQEGTGLEVNEGDLVIVEADRGTDLGTVAHRNVDWSVARDLKEHYVQEHYNWLMMFSRQGQSGAAVGPRPSSSGNQSKSLLTGFGAQGSSAEPSANEIKPKLIKRLAQTHEIHTLREKEGNEAKAKRMCQQKVAEHHLNMEILDAEFQMDWKKLTFYYFADSYINFNSLVTDLFKIYKTRIWMSAINPASFVSRNPNLPPIAGASSTYGMREQAPESRNKTENTPGGGFMAGMQDQAHDTHQWYASSGGGFGAAAISNPYAQYWAAQSMNTGAQHIGMARPQTSSPPVHRYSMEAGAEQGMSSSYTDRLQQGLHGLSLGN